jgi:hypothetical protein
LRFVLALAMVESVDPLISLCERVQWRTQEKLSDDHKPMR